MLNNGMHSDRSAVGVKAHVEGLMSQLKQRRQTISSRHQLVVLATETNVDSDLSASKGTAGAAALSSLDMFSVLGQNGSLPKVELELQQPGVFAIFDQQQELQYIGFTKNINQSLQTVFFRRPDKAWYYKFFELDDLDQETMMAIRNSWFDDNGGPPVGNKNPIEREKWQLAPSVQANTEGGNVVAAQELAAVLITKIRSRGCNDEIIADAALLPEGKVQLVYLTPEQMEKMDREKAEWASLIRQCSVELNGKSDQFEIFVFDKVETKGGYIFDVRLTHESRDSEHRVIVAKSYYEGSYNDEPEVLLDITFAFLLQNSIPRQTEGILLPNQFSANYFSISELHQTYPEFANALISPPPKSSFWRFQKIGDYGYKGSNEDCEALSRQFQID